MLRKIITQINYKELGSNKFYYYFQYNLEEYLVYKNNGYKLISINRLKEIKPIELISSMHIDDISEELNSIDAQTEIFEQLKDNSLRTVYMAFFLLTKLSKAKTINEDIDNLIIEGLTRIEKLGELFYISRYGLSMPYFKGISYENADNGILFFTRFNVKYIGTPNIYIPRVGQESTMRRHGESIELLFNPVTFINIYNTEKTHYNTSFFISADIKKTKLNDITDDLTNVTVHLNPTRFELISYFHFLEKYCNANDVYFKVNETLDYKFNIELDVQNYAKIRGNYLNRLNANIPNKINEEDLFEYKLIQKRILIKDEYLDRTLFSMPLYPIYLVTFIRIFIMENMNKKIKVQEFTHLYHDSEFMIEIREELPSSEELNELFKQSFINSEQEFDDEFNDY